MTDESYRRTNEPRPLEVESSTAGASGAGDLEAVQEFVVEMMVEFVEEPETMPVFLSWLRHHPDQPLGAMLANFIVDLERDVTPNVISAQS